MSTWDKLELLAEFLNRSAGHAWLAAGGVVAVLLAASAVAWAWPRLRRIRPVAEMADPAYNPALDRHQRILRQALRQEADPIPPDDDLDGLVIDWDDEMRRRDK